MIMGKVFGGLSAVLAVLAGYLYLQTLRLESDIKDLEADNKTLAGNVTALTTVVEDQKKSLANQKAAFDLERVGTERLRGNYAALDSELQKLQAKMAKREKQYEKAFMRPELTARAFALFYTRIMRGLEEASCTNDCDKDED